MATAIPVSPIPTPSTSAPPTPPYPVFPRLPTSPSIQRNASTSSSRTTSSTSSSLVATPIRPPPIETRTAATSSSQLPSRSASRADKSGNESPGGRFGGRGFKRNGPKSRPGSSPLPPNIVTSPSPEPDEVPPMPSTSASVPLPPSASPDTPRAPQYDESTPTSASDTPGPLRVTVSMDPVDAGTSTTRGREVPRSNPTSPTANRISGVTGKQRTLSVDRQEPRERERRQSQTSAKSNGSASGQKKPSLKDFILGEELGRGSYSTVVQASAVSSSTSPTSPGPPRQYAIKIINQAHLVQEKKVKYAMIERDALVRLNDIRKVSSPTTRGHTRGMSSSSSGGASSSTTLGSSVPLSPTLKTDLAGRRPSRSADPPEMVPERSEEAGGDTFPEASLSKAPSPVKEDFFGERLDPSTPTLADSVGSIGERPRGKEAGRSSKKPRRHSLAPSERSNKSTKASPVAHPGIIRLYSTFNDATSLYFVLDLAINGELLGFVRKFGSLDLVSARYYAAQLIDTLEFMHERGVIHRDLKPENILLDDEIRIKITDFGSAKLLDKDGGSSASEMKKRSFVGSADFVSPEVLRNEPAVLASDIWAFGCILYQFIVGRPPFRGATDYLTFQKILKKKMDFPDGFDEDARALVELVSHLDPAQRPTASEIKSYPFFASIDFSTLWTSPAPVMSTGLTKPVATLASADPESDIWAVFEDEVSDGGFEYDDAQNEIEADHRRSPQFDRHAAANAVREFEQDRNHTLAPPRPAFADTPKQRARGWSSGSKSGRTSSSSSGNRTALTGLLETVGMMGNSTSGLIPKSKSGRASRTSNRSDETRFTQTSLPQQAEDYSKWTPLLLANERIVFTSSISVRPPSSIPLPSFLLPAPKRLQLILTDFPRLSSVGLKDEDLAQLKVKSECVFVTRPSAGTIGSGRSAQIGGTVANRVVDVQEKGAKGFVVQTASTSYSYLADTVELRNQWLQAMKRVVG